MKLIIACDPSGGIGYKNTLPWTSLAGDLTRFKQLTIGCSVVMGRNTWESLPIKPLPERMNYVVSSNSFSVPSNTSIIPSLSVISEYINIWIIGGAKLIETSWDYITEVHLSRSFAHYTCDSFIDLSVLNNQFTMISTKNLVDHTYEVWKRNETIY